MKQSVKTSEGVLRSAGVQQNKNSGTRVANQTVDTTTNEGSKTMGRGFLIQTISPPPHLFGRDAGSSEAEALFSRLFPTESKPYGCRHQGRLWGHGSPPGSQNSHTQGSIWPSFFFTPVSISQCVPQVTNLLSVRAEAPLVVLVYIHRTSRWHCASLEMVKSPCVLTEGVCVCSC